MANPIMALIGQVFKPAAELIDNLHTSDEERIDAKARMLAAQTEVTMQILDYEARLQGMKSQIITAEANGQGILQRNWRPITMLTFLAMVVSYWYGWAGRDVDPALIDSLFTLIKIGLGGYIVGRSAEKVAGTMRKP